MKQLTQKTTLVLIACAFVLVSCPDYKIDHFFHDRRDREYNLELPPNYDGQTLVPLLVALHGYGNTGVGFKQRTSLDALAQERGMAVVFPYALGIHSSWHFRYFVPGAIDDIGFLDALIAYLLDEYAFDPDRVYLIGYSQGALLAHQVNCEIGDRFAAIAAIAGGTMPTRVEQHCDPPGGVPMLLVHATGDTVTGYNGGDFSISPPRLSLISVPNTAAYWRAANGCDPAPSFVADYAGLNLVGGGNFAEYVQWSDCTTGAPVAVFTIMGGVHDWPASHPGTLDPFNSGALALDFLGEHSRH